MVARERGVTEETVCHVPKKSAIDCKNARAAPWKRNHRLALAGDFQQRAAWRAPVVWIAHSHSESQPLRHLPPHWNCIMFPPHCGQTRLMIEEMMLAFGSPGMVSIVLMLSLVVQRCEAQPWTAYDGIFTGACRFKITPRWFATEFVWLPVPAGASLNPWAMQP